MMRVQYLGICTLALVVSINPRYLLVETEDEGNATGNELSEKFPTAVFQSMVGKEWDPTTFQEKIKHYGNCDN